MYRQLALVLVCYIFVEVANAAQGSDDARSKAVDKSSRILADLYVVLRNIAFPKSPYSTTDNCYNRFVFMSPGKVLNYYDYYPGDEYAASYKAKNTTAPETLVPPSVMEKWFDISDVVVSGDLNGGTTGKQLSVIYETILSQMSIKNFKTLYQDAEAKYNEAKNYLMEPVQNPVNLTENTTRMFLYSFYQEEYAQRRLDMEEAINTARHQSSSQEFELWFQRNYKTLNARVESAYTKWLVFGQKDLVELYKSYMDSTSAGAELEDARITLRASGVVSLDRSRTIYPVSFEPSNWYEYLLPKKSPPSRDMLIAKRSMLLSEGEVLNATIAFSSNTANENRAQEVLNELQEQVNSSREHRDNATRSALEARYRCMQHNSSAQTPNSDNPCGNFEKATDETVDTTFRHAQASSEYFSSSFLLNSNKQYSQFLQLRIDAIEREIEEIDTQLDNLSGDQVYLGGIVDSDEFSALNKLGNGTVQDFDSEWMQFEYDYDSTHIDTSQDQNSLNVAAGLSVGIPKGLSLEASADYGRSTADLMNAVNSASLKASGEILRVTIKRPWFRPSLFEDPLLYFVQQDDETGKATYVSPAPIPEKILRSYINGGGKNLYLLPEYVTSFLLARNVKLQFSGLDSSSVSHAMQMMAGGSISGSYDMFSLSASVGIGKQKQSVTADRTANGMIINIPGAQIIGYYTQVVPQFPKSQA